ncbi:MAG: type II toxin-antitoxin system RelE/ParE family toxin [Gammaproteobacteria bacterium]|nr:type II toxin-antitoxin system RelE/ParE family toxin [Gammaproteobacteria bacterium]
MAEIRWTEEAHHWLHGIYDYIAADNPSAAQKVVAGIYEKAQVLRSFPEIGYKYRTEAEGEIRILL